MLKVKRAIVSVSDKTGVVEFAKGLEKLGVEIISTGGTLALLQKNKVKAVSISSYTDFPEILEGRVKTLHPKIHGGLLFLRNKKTQAAEAKKHGIKPIDMVVVNLYPFEQVTKEGNIPLEQAVEEIDIGGPTMLRSAAKNFKSVAIVSDPSDYTAVLEEMKKGSGKVSEKTLYDLACKVFRLTSLYDTVISQYLEAQKPKDPQEVLPPALQFAYRKKTPLRYGENPHQQAALYEEAGRKPALVYKQLHGKELSYNNLIDMESAWDVVEEFQEPAACVIKHNTPSGVAVNKSLAQAVADAVDCDLEASFGGIVGLNRACDLKTAQTILEKLSFLEVIAAPSFAPQAVEILTARKNLRLVEFSNTRPSPLACRLSKMGLLVQEADASLKEKWNEFRKSVKCVTKKEPTSAQLEELFFAWRCVKVVKSNGIVLCQGTKTVGIGAGQVSRVDAVRIACKKAGQKAQGASLSSDAFFPMPDNIDVAAGHGIHLIVQPGGSVRDQEVIDAADRQGVAMVFTGKRHFRH